MKSLADEYFILRTNSIQRRQTSRRGRKVGRFRDDEDDDDQEQLLLPGHDPVDLEDGGASPVPAYVELADELKGRWLSRLEVKVRELDELHKGHLARPSLLDDEASSLEEARISGLTRDITEVRRLPDRFDHRPKVFDNVRPVPDVRVLPPSDEGHQEEHRRLPGLRGRNGPKPRHVPRQQTPRVLGGFQEQPELLPQK